MESIHLYETPRKGVTKKDCWFYHVINIPGQGTTDGYWDLRSVTRKYTGNVDFKGLRVLEIGPASGYLTAYMEQQGAEVVSVELPHEYVWDFVPYKQTEEEYRAMLELKRSLNKRLKNFFWFTHEHLGLTSKVHYGNVNNLPDSIGKFDISIIALVLTHTRDPISIIEKCASLTTKKLIIVDRLFPKHESFNKPLIELIPNKSNNRFDSWWYFSNRFFLELLSLMGFSNVDITQFQASAKGFFHPLSTFVARW